MIAGYPVSHGGNQLWSPWGRVLPLKAGDRTMRIYASVSEGQSGAPVWMHTTWGRFLVGVAVRGRRHKGVEWTVAARITQDVIRQIATWIRDDGDSPAMRKIEEQDSLLLAEPIQEETYEAVETESLPEQLLEFPEPETEEEEDQAAEYFPYDTESLELQDTEPDLYEFESRPRLRRTSLQFRVLNYCGLPMRHYFIIGHVVDAATGKRILAGGPTSTSFSGIVTFPRALVPAQGTLHLDIVPEYYEIPKLKSSASRATFTAITTLTGRLPGNALVE